MNMQTSNQGSVALQHRGKGAEGWRGSLPTCLPTQTVAC